MEVIGHPRGIPSRLAPELTRGSAGWPLLGTSSTDSGGRPRVYCLVSSSAAQGSRYSRRTLSCPLPPTPSECIHAATTGQTQLLS